MARRSIGNEEHWLRRSPCQGGVPARRNPGQEKPQPGGAPAKSSSGKEDLGTEGALGGPLPSGSQTRRNMGQKVQQTGGANARELVLRT